LEIFLNILLGVLSFVYIIEISTEFYNTKYPKLTAMGIFIISGLAIYYLKINTISDYTLYPLVSFSVTGVYLSYISTKWVLSKFRN